MSTKAQTPASLWDRPVSDQDAALWMHINPGFVQADLQDPDKATAQTVQYMSALVKHSLGDPIIARAWEQAERMFRSFPGGENDAVVAWWYAKYVIRRFVHHQEMLVHWLGLPDELQLLISPEALLRMESPKGDCAVYTTLIQTLLAYRGIEPETVCVAVNPARPDLFTHVYAQARFADGSRLPLDASHGQYAGWQAPPERVAKKKSSTAMGGRSGVRSICRN